MGNRSLNFYFLMLRNGTQRTKGMQGEAGQTDEAFGCQEETSLVCSVGDDDDDGRDGETQEGRERASGC